MSPVAAVTGVRHQPRSTGDEERVARAGLSRVAEPGEVTLGEAVAERGAATVWRELVSGTLRLPQPSAESTPAIPGSPSGLPAGAATCRAPRDVVAGMGARLPAAHPERDLRMVDRLPGRFLIPGDPQWPAALNDLGAAAPLGLWARGTAALSEGVRQAVAVVGARAATAYGIHVAAELATGLAERGWTVISGGAYGIDGAAHRGALAGGGTTIAVLACGVDVAYPRGHSALLERVVERGLILSELPPGSSPMRHRFLVRNRLIAALAAGTVVVEAAVRSGALSTARHAIRLNRLVAAVPGPVTSALSRGCHGLMRGGEAVPVTCAADVVDLVGAIGSDLAPVISGASTPRDRLDDDERRVLDAMPARRAVEVGRIAVTAGVPVLSVIAALGRLDALGLVFDERGRWRLSSTALA